MLQVAICEHVFCCSYKLTASVLERSLSHCQAPHSEALKRLRSNCSGRVPPGQIAVTMLRRLSVIMVLACVCLSAGVLGCSKEEYADKFGEPYKLAGLPEKDAPVVSSSGQLQATVSYSTTCEQESSFAVEKLEKDEMNVVALVRSELNCVDEARLDHAREVTRRVSVDLPSEVDVSTSMTFIAFPPDGDYELYLLKQQ